MRTLITSFYLCVYFIYFIRVASFDNVDPQSVPPSHNHHHSHSVVNVAAHDENTLATDEYVIPLSSTDRFKDDKHCDDESFECLLQRAKYTLKLLRIAQKNDRAEQLQQQQRHAEGKPSPITSSPTSNPAVEMSSMTWEGSSQPQLNASNERNEAQGPLHPQRQEEIAEDPKEQQHMEQTRANQPVDVDDDDEEEVTASTPSPKHIQESQRTAMDIFLSSPTAGNWNELVETMRQERDDSSSRRDLMNLIETITIHHDKMEGYDDDYDDDHSSVTLSLSSEPTQLSQSQQSLQSTQRRAMEAFLSSPTGLNWDDFVTSLGTEHDDNNNGSGSTLKNREETKPVQTVDTKPSILSTRWRQRKFQQQQQKKKNHQSGGQTRDHCRRLNNNVNEGGRNNDKGEKSLERRIEQILTLSPTATIADATRKNAGGNTESEMILNDLMTIDENAAMIQRSH